MKVCSKCKLSKGLCEFNKNKARSDGYNNYCKDCDHERGRIHYLKYKDRYDEKHKKYWNDKYKFISRSEYHKKYSLDHRPNINTWKYTKYHTDLSYKLLAVLRTRLRSVFHGKRKESNTIKLIGCSLDNLRTYLESKFDGTMSWENYGSYWEIDHIIPCSSFNLDVLDEQKKCFHFSNLQPLSKLENRKKSDFLPNGVRARDLL